MDWDIMCAANKCDCDKSHRKAGMVEARRDNFR
jgi:hypothetical protein